MQRGLLVEFSCNSPTLYLIAHWRALLVVRSFVLEWRVVVITVSMIADQQESTKPMSGYNETSLTHVPHEESIINIQLSYDI